MRINPSRSLLAIALIAVSAGGCATRAGFTSRMQSSYCAAIEDDPSGSEHQRRLRLLAGEGERGRRFLLQLAGGRDESLRVCSHHLLTSLRDDRVLPILREAAADTAAPRRVRISAVANLGEWQDAGSVDVIRAALRDSATDDQTLVALVALGRLDDERARAALREALATPRYISHRGVIIAALRRQEDRTALDLVRRIAAEATDTSQTRTLQETVLTLGVLGNSEDRQCAVILIERLTDPERRRAVAGPLLMEFQRLHSDATEPERGVLLVLVERLKASVKGPAQTPPAPALEAALAETLEPHRELIQGAVEKIR